MPNRTEVLQRKKNLRVKLKRLRAEVKHVKEELAKIDVMLTTGDYGEMKTFRFPVKGTKWRALIEVLATQPDKTWGMDDLMVRVGMNPEGGLDERARFRGRIYALRERGCWVERVDQGKWKITKAALKKLAGNPR